MTQRQLFTTVLILFFSASTVAMDADTAAASGGSLIVADKGNSVIGIVDATSDEMIATVPEGGVTVHELAVSADGEIAFAPIYGIPLAKTVQRIAVSTDGKWVFTADQDHPRLAVIDTATESLKTWVNIPDVAYGTAVAPDGKWLLITQPKTSTVAVLDLATMQVTKILDVPKSPQEIVVQPDGHRAYISCSNSGKIAVLNLETWQTETPIQAGKGVDGMVWAGH